MVDESLGWRRTRWGPNYSVLDPACALARDIAGTLTWFSPRFSPKDVPRFYDISSLTEHPALFRRVIDALAERYAAMAERAPTVVLGFDARGFLLGAPLALALKVPFVLMRKADKSPGLLFRSDPYHKEYAEAHPDTMSVRQGAIARGARVLLIDDLIATGGTAISGLQLIEASGGVAVEFAAVIGIPFLDGVARIHAAAGGRYAAVPIFTLVHDSSITDATCGDPPAHPEGASRIVPYAEALKLL